MHRTPTRAALAAAIVTALAPGLRAQAAPAAPALPAVGTLAPDFSLPTATVRGPGGTIRLSDYRGKTVVLAFFFKARTKG